MGQINEGLGPTTGWGRRHRQRRTGWERPVLWVTAAGSAPGAAGSDARRSGLIDRLVAAGAEVSEVDSAGLSGVLCRRWTAVVVDGGDDHPAWDRLVLHRVATSTPLVAVVGGGVAPADGPVSTLRRLTPTRRRTRSPADLVITVGGERGAASGCRWAGVTVPVVTDDPGVARFTDRDVAPRRVALLAGPRWWRDRAAVEVIRLLDPLLGASGAELVVIGAEPRVWRSWWVGQLMATRFTGTGGDMTSALTGCRLGIVTAGGAEPSAAVLTLVSHGVAVLATRPVLAGLPLVDGTDVLGFEDAIDLVAAAATVLDEPELLRRLAVEAYEAWRATRPDADAGHVLRRAIAGAVTARHRRCHPT